ncbi:flagellar hook-associated protein FlgL [Aliiglaciecola sp. CAU 1673]|uniref:flagellar hook-associated protein FlgL n=1 Tax=Aliiglaciecola sp. CAU 1673 TaxID=3032595 RepID=UPI0023DBD28D|nr:flagellar hook-associated protein FlgL [Aliiglaciecola sp. CAU 1673]MDF2178318.1 flagellar hook-associated protein FlgL [Aliiglaciecola sp. CAU 1673]
MRISTNQLYDRSIQNILDNQGDLSDIQQRLASGKKLLRPSDDPVGASKVIRLTEELDQITQFQRNNDVLKSKLEQQEAVMRNINDAVTRARQLAIQAGNGVMSAKDKEGISIEIGQIRDEVFDLMNARNASGEYIFAGFQSKSPAFVYDPTASGNKYFFQGDEGVNQIQLSSSVKLNGNDSGKTVFEDVFARLKSSITGGTAAASSSSIEVQPVFDAFHRNNYDAVTPANNNFRITINGAGNQVTVTNVGTGANLGTFNFASGEPFTFNGIEFKITGGPGDTVDFQLDPPQKKNLAQTLDDFFVALRDSSLSSEAFLDALDDVLIGMDNGTNALGAATASVGGRIRVADSIYNSNIDLEIATKSTRSDIQDVDYAQAVSDLTRQETALQAAQSTFSRVTGLTLFDFIR